MTAGPADETIKIVFVVDTRAAIQASQQARQQVDISTQQIIRSAGTYREQIDSIKSKLQELHKQTGESYKVLAEGMRRAAKIELTSPTTGKLDTVKYQAFSKALSQATGEAQKFHGIMKILGSSGAFLGAILGVSLVGILRKLVSTFQEFIKVGEEYAQTIYRLGVSINQLQRRGLDITIKSEIELIKELKEEYETFSQKGIIEAVAAVQMLTRNFGFSQEQIKKTIQLSMDLALVQGKDVAETAKQLALFYSSGYGEGLQHAGLAVNRMTVANEAHRMGLKKTYMELTEIERANAAYNLVTRQTTDLHKDAAKIQESLIGQIKEQRSSIEDVTNEIALRALPVELAWLKVKLLLMEAIADWITLDQLYKEQLAKEGKTFIPFIRDKEAWEKANEEMKDRKAKWEELLSETLDVKVDLNLDLSGEDQELADERAKLGQQIIDLYDDLEDAQDDYNDKSEELAQDHADKLAEIDSEVADELRDIWDELHEAQLDAQQDYQDKLADIAEDLEQEIADNYTDYYRKLEDIDRDYHQSVQDAARKYRENEIKAERDYQERMRRLREEFLFDLEDALREQDALQVLRLIRRYNLDKEQAGREKDIGAEERAEAYRQELADLKRQAAEKREAARRELEQEIADAQLAAQRKREDAQKALDEQLADAQAAYDKALEQIFADQQKRRDAENANYAERQAALDKDLEDRKTKILTAFGEEIGITGTSLQTVSDLFTQYFGEKGTVPKTIDVYISKITEAANKTSDNLVLMQGYLASMAKSAADTAASINASFATINWGSPPGISTPVPQPVHGYAFGGSVYANTPTTALFGEVPEVATFTPLSKLKSSNSLPYQYSDTGKGGNMKVQIILSPGLEAKIIDSSLGSMAEILQDALGARE